MTNDLHNQSILIVDDNYEFIKSFSNLLRAVSKNENLSIEFASTGVDAMKMIKTGDYQLIFIDIDLPDMDGVVLTHYIDFGLNCRNLNIVAISFYSEEYYKNRMLNAGAKAYVSKANMDAEQLAAILATYTSN